MGKTAMLAVIMVISILGLCWGAYYYFCSEKIVSRRIKENHLKEAEKDPEFRKWLEAEKAAQVRRIRQMGMTFVILEAIWIVIAIGIWKKS